MDNKEEIEYLIDRLEVIKANITAGNHHMAVAKILSTISALKTPGDSDHSPVAPVNKP